MEPNLSAKLHYIKTSVRWDNSAGKWVIRISGVTSGFVVHGGDGDNMTIEFRLDGDRYRPHLIE